MNKKGFTLVELLSVIVILSLLITIFLPGINKVTNNTKKMLLESKINTVVSATEKYCNKYINNYGACEKEKVCTLNKQDLLSDLESEGYIEKDYIKVDEMPGEIVVSYNSKKVKAVVHYQKTDAEKINEADK